MAKLGDDGSPRWCPYIDHFEAAKKQPRNCVLSPSVKTACVLSFSPNLPFCLSSIFYYYAYFFNMDISAGNSSKKRKIYHEEDDEDEAKMETFFALVRSIRETRDRWMGFSSGDRNNKTSKEQNRVTVWKPTFQLEDFAEEQGQHGNQLLAGASQSKKCCKEEEDAENKGIDLKLSL
ncbi:hypothetical protein VNO77_13866 [Canavalia gladiata]|uniref:Uncharacterized protein n=1 Tax=Canavalia gladiata TaxID=3824 RepID=A0AAN9LY72_CANGL